jgi:hypothetical protein
MAVVIINELEVIATPPPRNQGVPLNPQNVPPPGPKAEDIRQVVRKLNERKLRLRSD